MSPRSIGLSDQLYAYLIANAVREAEPLRRLREETAKLEQAQMQVAPEQGQLLALLVKLIGARRTLEIGTFTGYSAMAVALALPENGRLVACDIDANYAAIAARHWRAAGVAHKIELKLAPALETLDRLLAGGARDAFDITFIDADKETTRPITSAVSASCGEAASFSSTTCFGTDGWRIRTTASLQRRRFES
jgi:predicted O-methyltransferase YrrM